MNERRQGASPMRLIFIIIMIGIMVWIISQSMNSRSNYFDGNMVSFTAALEKGEVTSVAIEQDEKIPTGRIIYTTSTGGYVFNSTDVKAVEDWLVEKGYTDYTVGEIRESVSITTIIIVAIGAIAIVLIFSMLLRGLGGGANNQMMNFGKSRAQMIRDSKTDFDSVAGLAEEKEDLSEIVDFLRNPAKFAKMGARVPKGILLVGPPGTGKTLMAKAVAGEAKVPFFSISGSDFVEMFVGVGASRVRDLFAEAKKNAPCIVFVDEIDAVARRRGSGLGGGHDEREQTLNQLLVEMDGFEVNSGIIVMAATNRVDILDPAIMRPGRFDRKVMVQRPDVKAREQILHVHAKHKPLAEDVDLSRVAKTTAGFTGADLENLMNESAIRAAKANKLFISQEDIDQSFVKVGIGTEKKSHVISDEEKRITAYHEAGHAILFHVLPHMNPVHTISVIPTGASAAGYTMPLPERDNMFITKNEMIEHIMVSMGGRIAEELVFGDVTTGASADIKQATGLVRDMVTKYGMSEKVGFINCADEEEVFLARDYTLTHSRSDYMDRLIDDEERRILEECYQKAREIIVEHKDILNACAKLLVEKEKIYQEEFEALWIGKKVPAKIKR
ncbi:MAG: ATP-dependent zinc metalloprotease FtsH [Lachnospiraceae bacterium]|nr:ATP-dependent zinc metalloprotease FtsH [Lachnospiraceae bacterium]